MSATTASAISRRLIDGNVWLSTHATTDSGYLAALTVHDLPYEVLDSEKAVGRAMLGEIEAAAAAKDGPLVMILLGGRGAQALHQLLGEMALTDKFDSLLGRLNVFTQDALAPLRLDNGLSFVRDFERLLGPAFFNKVRSFTCMQTDATNLEAELVSYVQKLEALGGIDIFFIGLGPEAGGASHLAYIKPGSGVNYNDVAGKIPISKSILEHHISKFKAGGTIVTEADEAECRSAKYILTLGPAAILGARRVVQSIVDASTAPAKRECYAKLLTTKLAADGPTRQDQLNLNPGLWLRLHSNVRSLVLPDVLES